MPEVQQVLAWRGSDVVDRDGDKIGKIEEIYLDEQTDQPEWLAVKTGIAQNAEADGALSQDEEQQLYRHYGLDYGESRSDTGLAEGGVATNGRSDHDADVDVDRDRGVVGNDTSGPETDAAMTRSEEELRVGTRQRESGSARLRKVHRHRAGRHDGSRPARGDPRRA
jgi:sporulation protein YlmC with PRC-barrel domain